MKDTPIQILDHIYYRDEASLETNKFRIASNDSQRMLDKNFSVCFLSSSPKYLFIALNEKTYDTNEIIAIDNDICFKIRNKRFNLNRTIRMEIKNESKQNSNIWKV